MEEPALALLAGEDRVDDARGGGISIPTLLERVVLEGSDGNPFRHDV